MSSRQNADTGTPATRGTLERLEPLLSGLLVALLVTLTLGVAVAMGGSEQALVARVSPTAGLPTATILAAVPTLPASSTALPTSSPSPSPPPASATAAPTEPPTPRPSPTKAAACVPPSNWQLYAVRSGESLQTLAWRYWTSDYSILQANCLTSRTLRAGQRIYVPDVAPRQACGRPSGWVAYTVQRGDTLSGLSRRLGVTIAALKNANCLVGDTIYAGATLWVPRPLPTATATRRPAPAATRTPTSPPAGSPTATPENTLPPGSATPTDITPPPETPPTEEPTGTSEPGNTPPPTATSAETVVPAPPSSTPKPPDTPKPPPDTPVPPPPDTPEPPPDTPVPAPTEEG